MILDFRIAAAILNAFHKGIDSDLGDGPSIAARMLGRILKPNLLRELVSAKRLDRRSASFVDMSGDSIPGFPFPDPVVQAHWTTRTYLPWYFS